MGINDVGGEYVDMSSTYTPSGSAARTSTFTLPGDRESNAAETINGVLRKLADNEAGTYTAGSAAAIALAADIAALAASTGVSVAALTAAIAALVPPGTLNGQSLAGALTLQGTADQIAVSTVGPVLTARLATIQPAGNYVMHSDGAGGVSWSPFEPGGGLVSLADMWTVFFSNFVELFSSIEAITGPVITAF